MKTKIIFCFFIILLLSGFQGSSPSASPFLLNVPGDFATIQSAINATSSGDTVLVAPGTYVENINFNGKNIVVASHFITTQDTSYISQTVIDGNKNGHVVEFSSGEDSTSVLAGLTITNGATAIIIPTGSIERYIYPKGSKRINGGGIYCVDSSPKLEFLTIIDNTSGGSGGGIYCNNASPIMIKNIIMYNYSYEQAGGMCFINRSNPRLTGDIITDNGSELHEVWGWSCGPALHCEDNSSPELIDVTISNHDFGGINCKSNSNPVLIRCELIKNIRYGIKCEGSSPKLNNVLISKNWSYYGHSGAIYNSHGLVCNYSNPVLENVLITSNGGAGIYCYNSNANLTNVLISNNYQSPKGHVDLDIDCNGVCCIEHSSVTLTNVTISKNYAEVNIYDPDLSNNYTYYGVYCDSLSSLSLKNTIITENDFGFHCDEGGNIAISYSNISNNKRGNFYGCGDEIGVNITTNANGDPCDLFYNLMMNPLFVSEEDFHLIEDSPCINAGTAQDAPGLDIDGIMRVYLPDMGAYENPNVIVNVEKENIPKAFYLYPCSPNPFNLSTSIAFILQKASSVRLMIYNISGQKIAKLVDSSMSAGKHEITWDAGSYASGLYFCRLEVDDDVQIQKMMLVR